MLILGKSPDSVLQLDGDKNNFKQIMAVLKPDRNVNKGKKKFVKIVSKRTQQGSFVNGFAALMSSDDDDDDHDDHVDDDDDVQMKT